jgi:hypothetical protein
VNKEFTTSSRRCNPSCGIMIIEPRQPSPPVWSLYLRHPKPEPKKEDDVGITLQVLDIALPPLAQ